MNTSMIAASVTMGQLQSKLDTISNNMANLNTTGFKRRESTFSDLLSQQVNNQTVPNMEAGRLTPYGLRVGVGAKLAQTALRLEQGPLIQTERELDFALAEKDQFFQVETLVNGDMVQRLTRDGAFYLSEDPANANVLSIVNSNGDFLLDAAGNRMTIPVDFESIQLSDQGLLSVTLNDGTIEEAGQLGLIRVMKPQLLEAVGGNQFQIPDLAALGFAAADVFEAVPAAEQRLVQGSIEGSNVNLSQEMNDLLLTQRLYQFNSRSLSMADEMAGLVNGIRR